MKYLFTILILFSIACVKAQSTQKGISVHDPVMIKQDSIYYLFSTGNGIKVQSSKDLLSWKLERPVFATAQTWAVESIPGFKGHIWAPDISYHNNQYYLFYSVSTFGKNSSAIGVATNKTLNPSDSSFKWVDHGKVIESTPGKTHWNAIDPNVIIDDNGKPWMTFGSFWDGIKMVQLTKDLLSIDTSIYKIETIASQKKKGQSGNNAIEAPFIFKKNDYYYLFASIDYCCKGEASTYKLIVGRSKNVQGPYFDQLNIPLANGGGTILLAGNENWHGIGHNAVYHIEGKDYLIFHGYDAKDNGKSKLRIEVLDWKDGWPNVRKQP
ncbi:family 43 glycosylhydrolase [Pedobacter frigiditerrae]|nr:family 43 glycosylhydrolase [Pedobacter frigiditerrae]